ncbi:hypothetical protein [Dyadobacter luticola]|uniref:DUF5017 domain-containing protein n=1 Tax=Dyadobacter luticola TaxID=1979387 RepID=A0A5R9KW23_9BACT|nr:hypothetical protein [Dyadobacter luticola]TLV00277.1 hypothetical protein FEN17_12295 [Dyadobacter luticola]
MKLVQMWSVGLSLACGMIVSSCSKEDIQTPQPEEKSVNANSSLRQINAVLSAAPSFPSTNGPVGWNVYPANWKRGENESLDMAALPTGTSTLTHQWGDTKFPWAKPLTANVFVPGNATILTATTQFSPNSPQGERSAVTTKIKYLKPGKKYAIIFNVSTTLGDLRPGAVSAAYSKGIEIAKYASGADFGFANSDYVDFAGKEGQWISKTIIFTAISQDVQFTFAPKLAGKGEYSWVNIYVDKTSIKELN